MPDRAIAATQTPTPFDAYSLLRLGRMTEILSRSFSSLDLVLLISLVGDAKDISVGAYVWTLIRNRDGGSIRPQTMSVNEREHVELIRILSSTYLSNTEAPYALCELWRVLLTDRALGDLRDQVLPSCAPL